MFLSLLIAVWYYLLKPYIGALPNFQANVDKLVPDNKSVFKSKSGREVLPVEAQIALFAIDSLKFTDYKLYKSLGDFRHADEKLAEIYQRINEGAWPVPLDTASRNLIGFSEEINAVPGIKILLQYQNISVGTY